MPKQLTPEEVEHSGWNVTGVVMAIIIIGLLAVLALYYFVDIA